MLIVDELSLSELVTGSACSLRMSWLQGVQFTAGPPAADMADPYVRATHPCHTGGHQATTQRSRHECKGTCPQVGGVLVGSHDSDL